MTTYKQTVKLDWNDVQNICIKRNWYTCGTNENFAMLQARVWNLSGETPDSREWVEQLQRIAEDIKAHSETEYEVVDIMTALNMKTVRYFEEA